MLYQASVLGPLLFLLYINDLNQAIKFYKIYHFAGDTNLLCLSSSIKKLKQLVNADLKHLVNWLNANKISFNVKKLKWWSLNLSKNPKIRVCGKNLYTRESAKYLGVKIDANISWQCQVYDLSVKLNRANAQNIKIHLLCYFRISPILLLSCLGSEF